MSPEKEIIMYCSSCGATLQRDLKFCNRCGNRQPTIGSLPESEKVLTQLTEMVKYLSTAYGVVGLCGLAALFLISRELLNRGLTGEALTVITLGFLLVFGLGGLFLLCWARMIRPRTISGDNDGLVQRQVIGRETAEIPPVVEPSGSVTEYATRQMEPQKR